MNECPICRGPLSTPLQRSGFARGQGWYLNCDRCGEVHLYGQVTDMLDFRGDDAPHRRAITSHALRRMQTPGGPALHVYREDLLNIWRTERLPTPPQQVQRLILLLGQRQPSGNEHYVISPNALEAEIGTALRRDTTVAGWKYILDYLREQGIATYRFAGPKNEHLGLMLTISGWSRYDELQRDTSNSRTAFMAMKYGDEALDAIFRDCLSPAVAATGFELQRLDTHPKPGLIDARMEVEIRASRFMVADLTHGNHGAYWEAGFAAGLGKPVFYTCERGYFDTIGSHFDVSHHYTVLWEAAALETAAEELKAAIRRTLPTEAKLRD